MCCIAAHSISDAVETGFSVLAAAVGREVAGKVCVFRRVPFLNCQEMEWIFSVFRKKSEIENEKDFQIADVSI